MDFDIILSFLKQLSKNNNREWFEKNKPKYMEAKDQFDQFVAALLIELTEFDKSLAGLDPKKLTFRIYRDVRFSKDKRPYKLNMGASFSSAGKGIGSPGYYLHIEPGDKSFVAAGLYMPDTDRLTAVRQEIDYNGKILRKIINRPKFKKNYGDFWADDKLKRMPKGYPEDHPHAEWLKLKSFIVSRNLADKEIKEKKFLKTASDLFKITKPFNDFLTEAIA